MENIFICIFYDHLEYFTAIWYIIFPFWDQEKSGNPASEAGSENGSRPKLGCFVA
jgi:hypothetical protein